MKYTMLAITAFAVAALASIPMASAQQAKSSSPTSAEIERQAMQQGPATGRPGYLTHQEPRTPKRAEKPVDPKMLQPLTRREIGMLYNACIAYPECKVAYSKAYEHNQALLRAQRAAKANGQ